MSANPPKGSSPRLKPPTIGATAQKQKKNINIKPPSKPSKIITTPTKLNNQIAKQQSSPGTSLASDNAAANHSTSAALSTLHNASIANDPISNIDKNFTVFNYPSTPSSPINIGNINIPQHNNTGITFATIAANDKTPSRDQAIVFNSIDGIPQKDYVLAVGKIVSPKNITFVSRISNNRFCIFLSSKQILDNLIETHPFITINNQDLPFRRLNNPAKRIVISNVCPSINNQIILEQLKIINITPVSQISHLKAGIFAEGYDHILSFRRQMYIKYDDIPKLPSSLLISANESQFRIFFTDDKITCFICKSTGHTSLTCKKSNLNNTEISSSPQQTNAYEHNSTPENQKIDQIDISQSTISSQMLITSDETPPTWNIVTETSAHKRQAPPTTSSSAPSSPLHSTSQEPNLLDPKHHHKKIKTIEQTTTSNHTPTNQVSSFTQPEIKNKPENRSRSNSRKRFSEELDTHLDPISHIFNEHNHTNLNFSQFKHIIEIIATLDHPLDTIHEYETTGNHILELLEKIRPSLLTVKAKNNITRITNKLFKAIDNEAFMDASEAESDTY
ncbi:unnamed protein product [Macrosiphum euphorbiae]|uniref:DNA replication licensing factor MCM4-like n=1 Tax=Macrosiphum euphorbiae TaxID=13131 RepID=A0AAV0W468_9HEMI|nr:unnamed protein product [Macrosiphum euphorbiae]